MNSHNSYDLLAYNTLAPLPSKVRLQSLQPVLTVHNCTQQLRHGKSVWFLSYNIPQKRVTACPSIADSRYCCSLFLRGDNVKLSSNVDQWISCLTFSLVKRFPRFLKPEFLAKMSRFAVPQKHITWNLTICLRQELSSFNSSCTGVISNISPFHNKCSRLL